MSNPFILIARIRVKEGKVDFILLSEKIFSQLSKKIININ